MSTSKKKKSKTDDLQKKPETKETESKEAKPETKENKKKETKEEKKEDLKNEVVENKQEKVKDNNTKNKDKKKVKKEETKKEEAKVEDKTEKKEPVKEEKTEENKKENLPKVQDEKKDLIKEEKPDYVKDMLKAKKIKTIVFVLLVSITLLLIFFSTTFALLNMNNVKITKGVSIKNIDISDLTKEEARERINSGLEKELTLDLNLKYNEEYNLSLNPEQIEFKYDIEKAIEEAYKVGRTDNIIINNYTLLLTTLLGKEISIDYAYNEDFLNEFVDDTNSKLPGLVVEPTYSIEGDKLIVYAGEDGVEVEKEKLKEDILKSISSRNIEEVTEENYSQIIDIPVKECKANKIDMEKIYSEIHHEPQDAYFELEPYKIYPDIDGVDLQISLEEAKNQITGETKEYQFDLKITKASKTINDLGTEAFPYLISSFSTRYDASNTNRSTNLRIAAEKINGKVLMPGEVFSYNQTVGKRTVEEGYKDAKIYADGSVVDGLGGGICQISSTLYNAVLLANLEIVERRNHSFTTSYLAAGRDATVVWGTIDFQFKNSRNYPIKIEASVKNGVAEFKIHGMQEENEYEISILPSTTASIPFSTNYVQDPTLAPGQQVVAQAGHLGYKVTTYIVKKLNGVEVSREVLSNDIYQPMKSIIRIGPAPAEAPIQ